jgi:hypothetical protein
MGGTGMASVDTQARGRRLERARTGLRCLAGVGLLLAFGHGVIVAVTDGLVYPPHAVWKSGLIITTAACWVLTATILRWPAPSERVWYDGLLGVLGLLEALLALAAARLVHGIVGHQVFFGIILGLLFPASLALLASCWWVVRHGTRPGGSEDPGEHRSTLAGRWAADKSGGVRRHAWRLWR